MEGLRGIIQMKDEEIQRLQMANGLEYSGSDGVIIPAII